MALPTAFKNCLRLPLVAAPMFLASGPELVIENCKAGVVGTFPALNQRTSAGFEQWLVQVKSALLAWGKKSAKPTAPFGVNLIVHKTNPRLQADLDLCVEHQVPLIITSLGAVASLVDRIHQYGGVVFHDVINVRHAKKAADAGVDGLIAVAAGAGGHAGLTSPFALVSEIRQFFDKTVLLAGAMSHGKDIAAAQLMGADLAYMGTRFISTQEALVTDDYKEMIVNSRVKDIVYTAKISGVDANFLRQSIVAAGIDLNEIGPKAELDFGAELTNDSSDKNDDQNNKKKGAWLNIWSAGQGVGAIHNIPTVAELVECLKTEYSEAIAKHQANYQAQYAK